MDKKNYKAGNEVNKKKSAKKQKRNNKFLKIFLIIIIILSILGFGIYYLLNNSYFNLEKIEVTGYENYTPEFVKETLEIQYGNNIFKEWFKALKHEKTALSFAKEIDIKFVIPNTLTVNISPRNSAYFAYNSENGKYYSLDNEYYILEEVNIEDIKDEIIIQSITFDDNVVIGSRLNEIDIKKIGTFLNIKKSYDEMIGYGKVTKVNFANSLTTIVINGKLNIIFQNDNNLAYNMSFLKGILEKLEENPVGTIDMTKTNPTFSSY